jgi:hypothetical protein
MAIFEDHWALDEEPLALDRLARGETSVESLTFT